MLQIANGFRWSYRTLATPLVVLFLLEALKPAKKSVATKKRLMPRLSGGPVS
jgi:hypothetical protein